MSIALPITAFLTCSICREVIHTALARRDYYACKGRRTTHKCQTKYMGRGKLERLLDGLFADHLTKPAFLENCVETLRQRSIQTSSNVDIARLTAELKALQRKRERVIDGFVEGVIMREERDQRLIAIEDGIRVAQDTLAREPADRFFDTGKLIEAFAPLVEWEYWTRDQKRQVLSTLIPDIRVSDYKVDSLGLSSSLFSNEDTHRGRGSSPPPA